MNSAFEQLAQEEATAMVRLLEEGGRKVIVVWVAREGEDAAVGEAVSPQTSLLDAQVMLDGIEEVRTRLKAKIEGAIG